MAARDFATDEELAAFGRLTALVRRLRGPDGCPWDRVQSHGSLRPYALEEAREVVAAIGAGDPAALAEELGDLLLQVLLHAVIAEEEGTFTLVGVLRGLGDKLVRRHPHVFGGAPPAGSPEEVARRWQALKEAEAAARDGAPHGSASGEPPGVPDAAPAGRAPGPGVLRQVPRGQPALVEAQRLGAAARGVGFDWDGAAAAWPKLAEEQDELRAAWSLWREGGEAGEAGRARVEEELGDLLFAAAQVGRLLGIDAEVALVGANDKFRRRFARMEARLAAEGRDMRALTLAELDRVWERVKAESASGEAGAS